MKALAPEHRQALAKALTARPVGRVVWDKRSMTGFAPSQMHLALAEDLGLTFSLVEYQVTIAALAEHLTLMQQRLERLEAAQK